MPNVYQIVLYVTFYDIDAKFRQLNQTMTSVCILNCTCIELKLFSNSFVGYTICFCYFVTFVREEGMKLRKKRGTQKDYKCHP